MKDADNPAGERSVDVRGSGRHKKTNGSQGNLDAHKSLSDESKGAHRQDEDQKGRQVIKEEKRSSKSSRGPEDWGGYSGY